jgi:DNA-binding LytR/AlgR family response regulator
MDIVIVEDERLVANDLANILRSNGEDVNVKKILSSVKEAVAYFKENTLPQLIFSDIQLGDGYSFEIFKELEQHIPVVYCTAHDRHALEAFRHNGIAYVLKPYSNDSIKEALDKCRNFQTQLTGTINYDLLLNSITKPRRNLPTLLINYKNRIIPIKMSDVAYFFIENKMVNLATVDKVKYTVNSTLDELENTGGDLFYRANRQFLVNKKSIKEVVHYGHRKLFLSLDIETEHEIIINKNNMPAFLEWLQR